MRRENGVEGLGSTEDLICSELKRRPKFAHNLCHEFIFYYENEFFLRRAKWDRSAWSDQGLRIFNVTGGELNWLNQLLS